MNYASFMRKLVLILLFFYIALTAFGQDLTFQGLSWGASKEQIISKLGIPDDQSSYDDGYNSISYMVSLNGYKTWLDIGLKNGGMRYASYIINWFDDLDSTQVKVAFLEFYKKIEEKYGAYSELISTKKSASIQNIEDTLIAWHFKNFHIIITAIEGIIDTFSIEYCPDSEWNIFENEIISRKLYRFPNLGL